MSVTKDYNPNSCEYSDVDRFGNLANNDNFPFFYVKQSHPYSKVVSHIGFSFYSQY